MTTRTAQAPKTPLRSSKPGLVRCAIRRGTPRAYPAGLAGERLRLIVQNREKWVNGSLLRYAFFDRTGPDTRWMGDENLKHQVRAAFQRWKDVGIGLRFEETSNRAQAEVRVGFMPGDGHWSYVGREVRDQGVDDRTMNLDPDDGSDNAEYWTDVACHEIGHTLGFPHEHQNPNAGIVWNEEAVYAALAGPPNFWSRQTTFSNIIEKIPPDRVQGSGWDPNSIMHYPFEAGLIQKPEKYRTEELRPAGGLSARDKEWVKTFYPDSGPSVEEAALAPLTSKTLSLSPGQQRNFLLKPQTGRYYEIRTFGTSDAVLVLFDRIDGEDVYVTGDDDSGEDRNAYIRRRLHAGHTYVLRIRLYYASAAGETAVMWW